MNYKIVIKKNTNYVSVFRPNRKTKIYETQLASGNAFPSSNIKIDAFERDVEQI